MNTSKFKFKSVAKQFKMIYQGEKSRSLADEND